MEEKKNIAWDIGFIVFGVLTLVLLFMPAQYAEWRIAGYIGVGIFLAYLVIREVRRKRTKKENPDDGNADNKE